MKFLVFAILLGSAWAKPPSWRPVRNLSSSEELRNEIAKGQNSALLDSGRLSLGTFHSTLQRATRNLGYHPMENPDLFQGDILGFENVDDRNVIPYQQMRWTNKVVPYVIDLSLRSHTPLIRQAMQDYHTKTCIKFVPRTFEWNHIRLFSGQGCYSNVGMIGGQQPVSLGDGCMQEGIIIHELGHAIGFFHEQNRSDRDRYLIIYWENIETGMELQFALLKPHENLLLDPFDYNSIMLYSNTAFSKDHRSHTMEAKNGQPLLEAFEKPGLSASDVRRIKLMYRC